ncbi:MAG: hypothetical protein IKR40_12940 [Treponema sp.]|nr:hypothetical protein [Treponema sp.]
MNDDNKRLVKSLLIGFALFAVGITMIEMTFTEKDFELAARICMPIFGLLFLVASSIFLVPAIDDIKLLRAKRKNGLKNEIANADAEPEDGFSVFRSHYKDFFSANEACENPKVQNDVTQIYRNILELKRNRLKKMNVDYNFKSIRKKHSKFLPPLVSQKFSDGKYNIEDVKEDIASSSEFRKDGKVIYSRADNDIAHYTVASAKYVSQNEIACPNCGAPQTKEQLLDGCDYCKTKFMVEDLSEKITDFAMRSDYELQYNRYKEVRKTFAPRIGFTVEAVVCVFYILYLIVSFPTLSKEMSGGILTYFFLGALTAMIAAVPFAFIAIGLFYTFVFPVIQIGASINYVSKKILDKQKAAEAINRRMQDFVKQTDPNFSISAFYSNIQNKLATVFFAETDAQRNAFAVCDLSGYKDKYKNVIDLETEYICMKKYSVSDNLQNAWIEAAVKYVVLEGDKSSVKTANIEMLVTKSAECKTQIVCAPSVLRCKGCGASLSLLEGKRCRYCDTEIDLEKSDWVIREYRAG